MSIALLIIDVQKEFYKVSKDTIDPTIEYINYTSDLFRQAGQPVVFVQDMEGGSGPGSEGFEVIDDLVQAETDYYVTKEKNNAFFETKLHDLLQSKGIKFVVIAGYAAEYCVLFTLNGALERDYGASLLQHGVSGLDPVQIRQTHLIRPTISLEAVYYILKGKDQ